MRYNFCLTNYTHGNENNVTISLVHDEAVRLAHIYVLQTYGLKSTIVLNGDELWGMGYYMEYKRA